MEKTKSPKKKTGTISSESIKFGIEIEAALGKWPTSDFNDSAEFINSIQSKVERLNSEMLDASGRDGGPPHHNHDAIEVAIEPASFEWLTSNRSIFKFASLLKENNFSCMNESSGMHIHIDRKIFTSKSFITFVNFLRNNKKFLHDYSDRGTRTWFTDIETTKGKMHKPFTRATESEWLSVFTQPKAEYGNHCLLLNSNGCGTIECRFFNSVLDTDDILANLEFVRALCYFIKSKREKTLAEFLSYILDYTKKYSNCVKKLTKKKYYKNGLVFKNN